jgi:hypothetical protein
MYNVETGVVEFYGDATIINDIKSEIVNQLQKVADKRMLTCLKTADNDD